MINEHISNKKKSTVLTFKDFEIKIKVAGFQEIHICQKTRFGSLFFNINNKNNNF